MISTWSESELVPIRERVFQYLKNAILNGELKPGDRLVERDLAEKLNISRTPIREALFRLESLGFVVTLPRKGVVVAQVSAEEIQEIFTILSALEPLAAKLAARKMDEETAREFDATIRKMDRILESGKDDKFSEFHMEIHDQLYKAAKSPHLYEMLMGLMDYIRFSAQLSHGVRDRGKKAVQEHREIMAAVRDGDEEMAELLTKVHVENSLKAYFSAAAE